MSGKLVHCNAVWADDLELDCNVLVVDEAHDLSPMAQQRIADWINSANH